MHGYLLLISFLIELMFLYNNFRNFTINQYALTLINVWEKAFGTMHVVSPPTVVKKLKKIVKDYYNKVYNKGMFI